MKRICFLGLAMTLIALNCSREENANTEQIIEDPKFVYRSAKETNVDFQNNLKNSPELNILNYIYYYNGAGVALADFNNDGKTDIYFTANETADRLYLNQGGFKFKDVTLTSGIDNANGFTTGVTSVDINNDGLLDIYISKVGRHLNINDHNKLYLNTGITDGVPRFSEVSADYNLDLSSYATQSAFFDYDLDGDLDVFILNHSVHPNKNYGRGSNRKQVDSLSGDMLLENINGRFVDVSESAGIFQGKIGYGLGISISDINSDGYPDIYIGNDFFENDYLYINQGNKTFKEIQSSGISPLGHTTHFSMGNVISDLNNDLMPDIVSLDMLPQSLRNYKTSGLEYGYPIYENYLRQGYQPQYMQNTLHVNRGDLNFMETGYLSGIAATEWSWSPLAADFDNDGLKDLYITNGILGATNDMDFINFISDEKIQSKLGGKLDKDQLELIKELPEKKIANYFFRNDGNNFFKNMKDKWLENKPSFSHGAAYADLDNDGDLDIVVNNTNETAYILENKWTDKNENKSLKINFKGSKNNRFGLGAKAIVYARDQTQIAENFNNCGFISAKEPKLYFGLGETETIDSLIVIWPDGAYEKLLTLDSLNTITLDIINAKGNYYDEVNSHKSDTLSGDKLKIKFTHKDKSSIEFTRDPLIPFATTNQGPDVSVSDVDNDGKEDVFLSGAKGQASALFLQKDNGEFKRIQQELFAKHALNEDIAHIFTDINNDGWQDLIVVSGGNEFKSGQAIAPRVYKNEMGIFSLADTKLKDISVNASTVKTADLDGDGLKEIIIGSDAIDLQFGKTPKQYIFKNLGNFNFENVTAKTAPSFNSIGNVKDIVLKDLDQDGDLDMVVAGHWMPISIFLNSNDKLNLQENSTLNNTNGWWNTLAVEDFDNDGDYDIVAGNWGLNSRLNASPERPLKLYSHDFDNNGKVEPIITYFYGDEETVLVSKEILAKQLPYINKKYLSFNDFAEASIEDVFGKDNLKKANTKYIYELASCYFINDGNLKFRKTRLPSMAQVSAIFDIHVFDANQDGNYDIYLTGNNFEISTQLSRLDASRGELFLFNKDLGFQLDTDRISHLNGAVRNTASITIGQSKYLIVTRNNDLPLFLLKDVDNNED